MQPRYSEDPLLRYAKIEYKNDYVFVYNWIKNNPEKEFLYLREAK